MRHTRQAVRARYVSYTRLLAAPLLAAGFLLVATPAHATSSPLSEGAEDRPSQRSEKEAAAGAGGLARYMAEATAAEAAAAEATAAETAAAEAAHRRTVTRKQYQRNPSGFQFGAPKGSFGIRAGWMMARANSDIYEFNNELLTLEKSDYNAPLFGMDFSWAINDRVDAVFGFEYSSTSPLSEFRDFVDEFGSPIVQRTKLQQVPLTASLRVYLVRRGRQVGSYAWVPTAAAPYVGAGAGFTWWKYQQWGDFVDFFDFTIFEEVFETKGWSPTAHVFGGVDIGLSPRIALALEGRYAWADGDLAPAFVGFEPIDLSGFRGSVGINFRF